MSAAAAVAAAAAAAAPRPQANSLNGTLPASFANLSKLDGVNLAGNHHGLPFAQVCVCARAQARAGVIFCVSE